MGYDASAYTVIGIEVPGGDLMTEETTQLPRPKGCSPDAKFHPDTGKPLTRTESVPIPGYEPGDHLKVGAKTYPVKTVNCDDDRVVISIWSQEASGYGNQLQSCFLEELPSGEELEADKAALKKALGALWKDENFGLFTILYESY